MEKLRTKNEGFTLIELLVVIAIIGLISSIVLVSLNSARVKARDAKRIAEIKQIQTALELYYDDNNAYPLSPGCGATIPGTSCSYINQDPIDPKQGTSAVFVGNTYFYYSNNYGGGGQWYMIVFKLENTSHFLQTQDGVTTCDGTFFHYGNGSNGIITIGANCAQ
jgi:prepilin-type N-terminal cleavage/methylation domain-containing protein